MCFFQGLYDQSCTSGSGAGIPLLAQRTVSRSIQLVEIIGELEERFLRTTELEDNFELLHFPVYKMVASCMLLVCICVFLLINSFVL